MADFQERVVGFEMEYSPSIITQRTQGSSRTVERVSVTEEVQDQQDHDDDGFLDDGFRSYTDCGMTEIATPETYPNDVGTLQLVSEEMLLDGLRKRMKTDKIELRIDEQTYLHEHILPLRASSDVTTSGFHENYQPLDGDLASISLFLGRFFATASCWTGQGNVSQQDGLFMTAQKVGLWTEGNQSSLYLKGVSPNGYTAEDNLRYEARFNNYPTTHWQLKYRAAYVSAVIRALEQGLMTPDVMAYMNGEHSESTLRASVEAAFDPSAGLSMFDGEPSAIEIQLNIAEKVASLAEKYGFPDYESEASREVARIVSALKDKQYRAIATCVPWVLKLLKLEGKIPAFAEDRMDSDADIIKAREICITLDSRGFEGSLDVVRAHTVAEYPEYEHRRIMAAQIEKANRLQVALDRGKSVSEFMSDREFLNIRHTWMTSEPTIVSK